MITYKEAYSNYLNSVNKWKEEIFNYISETIEKESKRGITTLGFSFNNERYRESDRKLFFDSVDNKFKELGFNTKIKTDGIFNKKPIMIWINWSKSQLK